MRTVSVTVITRNEAARIARCLESVGWADERIVVDSESTDGTADVCRPLATKILVREFDTFDRQKNFALDQATGDWILSLDADEVVSPALAAEVRALIARDGDGCDGFLVRRENHVGGRPVRHLWGHDALVRLVRRGHGRFRGDVHEKLEADGLVGTLREPLLHFNSTDLREWIAKNRHYVELEAGLRYRRGERFRLDRALLAPPRVFFFRYVALGGYKDGAIGLVLALLLAVFTFRMHVRLRQLGRSSRPGRP